jgi:hypothetical protein
MTFDEHALWDKLYNSARTTEASNRAIAIQRGQASISILAERHGMY